MRLTADPSRETLQVRREWQDTLKEMKGKYNQDYSIQQEFRSDLKEKMTSWTVAHQAPLSMGFSRQEYWSGLPFPFSKASFISIITLNVNGLNSINKRHRLTEWI